MFSLTDGLVANLLDGHPSFVIGLARLPIRFMFILGTAWLASRYLLPSFLKTAPNLSYILLHATWYLLLLAALPFSHYRRPARYITHSYCDSTEDLLLTVQRKIRLARRLARRVRNVHISSLLWLSVGTVLVTAFFI